MCPKALIHSVMILPNYPKHWGASISPYTGADCPDALPRHIVKGKREKAPREALIGVRAAVMSTRVLKADNSCMR